MGDTRIGISGWTYAGWRDVFYPPGLARHRELEFASREVNSIEINGSFYSLQRSSSYLRWYQMTPADFVFAVKANRYITHVRRLTEIETPLANFFASGILALREKLGPILWQFPPNMKYDGRLFERFLASLPTDTREAASLASNHAEWLRGRTWTEVDRIRPLRHAIEVRNASFLVPEFVRLLKTYGAALVFSDSAGTWPYREDITADFVYIRLHGVGQLYVGGYGKRALDDWAERIRVWRSGRQRPGAPCVLPDEKPKRRTRDAYVYFDNDVKVRAPFDAMALLDRLTDFRPARELAYPKAA